MLKGINKIWKVLLDVLPVVWGILWSIFITGLSLGGCIWVIKWFFNLLGVNV